MEVEQNMKCMTLMPKMGNVGIKNAANRVN